MLPQILDTYILTNFVFYFTVLLASFVSMSQIYNFFELLGDIVRNQISLAKVFTYLFFLTPQLIYKTLPISVLVGVLVTFGVLTKHNEVTAFKACGVSLHRLAIPILVASSFLCGRPVRLRSLLRAGSQPPAGRAAQRDQGPRRADLSEPRA